MTDGENDSRVIKHLDANALRHNIDVVKRYARGCRVLAVVKADAYGHGIEFAVRALSGNAGDSTVDGFAVATVDEAIALRRSDSQSPVWVLSDCSIQSNYRAIIDQQLSPVIHDATQIDALNQLERMPDEVIVKTDTGMGRLGFSPDKVVDIVNHLRAHGVINIRLMSHLANADHTDDTYTTTQIERFEALAQQLDLECSLANSAGVLAWPTSHYKRVRPGIMMYGVSPILAQSADHFDLKPVMTLSTRVLSIREFDAGQPVGYGGTYVCSQPTRAALLACGYGDGYPRQAPSGTEVRFKQGLGRLIGRVSMDSIAVNISNFRGIEIGQRVVLWGRGLPAEQIAAQCDTIAYDLFCGLTSRVTASECFDGID
ncbi:MAG: alanine racemase [marine bacterium B5-7]|nr:MAG: alanine racemase [marine bacterium B5-7]